MSTASTTGSRTTAPKRSPKTRPRTGASAFDTRPWWKPEREELVESGVPLLLALIAVYGLTTVYDGPGVLLVGVSGAALGGLAAWLVTARGLSPVVGLGLVIVALFAGSGVADSGRAIGGVIPGPGSPEAMVSGLVHSWRELLTTAPPVDLTNGLGVVPYVLGFVTGVGGVLLARLTTSPLLPTVPGLVALIGSIVLGALSPASIALQGGGFLVVALAWGAWRSSRSREVVGDGIYWPRVWGSIAMLAVLVPVGLTMAPRLPLVDDADRLVFRKEIVPPFEAADYGSPLATIRRYRTDEKDHERTFLRVEGLPEGALVRLATMDTYDGVVWTVSGDDAAGSGRFKRVGSQILPVPPGERVSIDVTVEAYEGVWLPSVGTLRSVTFGGDAAESLERSFRYNPMTGTAASTYGLVAGAHYSLDVVLPPDPDDEELEGARVGSVTPAYPPEVGERLGPLTQATEGAISLSGSDYARARELETLFASWYFSDGGREATGPADVAAGHSVARLVELAEDHVGNAEQYAAAMALVAQQMGMPARVVMGFRTDEAGSVDLQGGDVTAWVEIEFQEHGWVPFHPTPNEDQEPEPLPTSTAKVERDQQPVPPPTYLEPPAPNPPLSREDPDEEEEEPAVVEAGTGLPPYLLAAATYVGLPLVAVSAVAGGIVLAKVARRRHRKNRGTSIERLNGAWLEAVDRLRDLGVRPDPGTTRQELAMQSANTVAWQSGGAFAARVDQHMFGPDEPDEAVVRSAWSDLANEVRAIHAPLSRRERMRARVSLASLRRVPTVRRASSRKAET